MYIHEKTGKVMVVNWDVLESARLVQYKGRILPTPTGGGMGVGV